MPKKAGIVFVAMGAVLMLSALLLFSNNRQEDEQAGQEAQAALEAVQAAIEEQAASSPDETESSEQPSAVLIDGYEYIGFLSIPSLELELPIMADWDYNRLKLAPCRQAGAVETDDLVIAGHNYKRHFGYLKDLEPGSSVTFTDLQGSTTSYEVIHVYTIDPKAVDTVLNSEYDLVLYTCTYGGATRVGVFCDRADGSSSIHSGGD